MTDLRKAAEMALEYLEYLNELDIAGLDHEVHTNALRQALAQPANQSDCGHEEYKPLCQMCVATKQKPWDTSDMAYRPNGLSMDQEPVAWEKNYDIACALLRQAHDILATTQYPIKRPWVSLTEEESSDIYNAHHNTHGECITSADDLVLDIEAKLKEKNT